MHRLLRLVLVRRSVRTEHGASLVEYALLVALIALAAIAAVTFLGSTATDSFNTSGSSIFGV
jgi:pilus assembly protein Flp/PilA